MGVVVVGVMGLCVPMIPTWRNFWTSGIMPEGPNSVNVRYVVCHTVGWALTVGRIAQRHLDVQNDIVL